MTDRDRLIELLENFTPYKDPIQQMADRMIIEKIADHLLANGVIVPPCNVGDTLYQIVDMSHTAHKSFVSSFSIRVEPYQIVYRNLMGGYSCIPFDDFGKTVFLTKEEAEEKLKECEGK